MNKKAQGLSMNVIIIAAIALLVLVILAVLLLRAGGSIDTGTSCEGLGGICADDNCADVGVGYFKHPSGVCSGEQICCRTLSIASGE